MPICLGLVGLLSTWAWCVCLSTWARWPAYLPEPGGLGGPPASLCKTHGPADSARPHGPAYPATAEPHGPTDSARPQYAWFFHLGMIGLPIQASPACQTIHQGLTIKPGIMGLLLRPDVPTYTTKPHEQGHHPPPTPAFTVMPGRSACPANARGPAWTVKRHGPKMDCTLSLGHNSCDIWTF